MAKKLETWQQKAARERAERAAAIEAEVMEQYRIAKEQERLFLEQEAARVAALTADKKAAEEAAKIEHEEAIRNLEIETARRRSQPVEPRPYRYVYEDDEE